MRLHFSSEAPQPVPDHAFLYVADFGEVVKVGMSIHPSHRVRRLGPATGRVVRRFAVSQPLKNAAFCESRAHSMLREHKVAGEFYRLSFDDVIGVLSMADFREGGDLREFLMDVRRAREERFIRENYAPVVARLIVNAMLGAATKSVSMTVEGRGGADTFAIPPAYIDQVAEILIIAHSCAVAGAPPMGEVA